MQIHLQCSRCGTKLQADETLLHGDVRCPQCEYLVRVEPKDDAVSAPREISSTSATEADVTTEPMWYLRIPEGRVYGPVPGSRLDRWVAEGRVAADCQLREAADDHWHSAVVNYSMLGEEGNPFRRARRDALPGRLDPHRGKLIFSLALVGCVVPFLSVWPAILGARDLRQMNLGKMDPRGDVLTRAGQAIAIVSSMIWIGAFGVTMLVLLTQLFGSR